MEMDRLQFESRRRARNMFCLWRNWLNVQIVGQVPEELEFCEFNCRKPHCEAGEWESCDRRLTKGSGETRPKGRTGANRSSHPFLGEVLDVKRRR